MDPGSRRNGWGIRGNLHFHVCGTAGDTAGVQLRRRGDQQHDYGITNREGRTLLVFLPGGDRVLASSAADLDLAIRVDKATITAMLRRRFDRLHRSVCICRW